MAGNTTGAIKVAVKRIDSSVESYLEMKSDGMKHCRMCRSWKPRTAFNADNSRYDKLISTCRQCQNRRARELYIPVPESFRKPKGPPAKPARSGDKIQARQRVNKQVKAKRILKPVAIQCLRCGDINSGRRHEYHHHNGYSSAHHLDVIVLCVKCHRKEK